jgi:purine-binding chemotaxis protein CheW
MKRSALKLYNLSKHVIFNFFSLIFMMIWITIECSAPPGGRAKPAPSSIAPSEKLWEVATHQQVSPIPLRSGEPHQACQLVVFTLDRQRYAVPLSVAERVVRMIEITPVPHAPDVVLGVINAQGRVIPVVDIRRRFRLPTRQPRASDQLLLARTTTRAVGLVVDAVIDVITPSDREISEGETILAHLPYVSGVVKYPDGLILIHDLDTCLSLDEEQALHEAIG